MSDSTASSTTANDLDLIYLKGIMESPAVLKRNTHVHVLLVCGHTVHVWFCFITDVLHVSGAGGELKGSAPVSSEGEQCGTPAGDPERPGPLQTSLQHSSRAHQYSDTASLPGEAHTGKSRVQVLMLFLVTSNHVKSTVIWHHSVRRRLLG